MRKNWLVCLLLGALAWGQAPGPAAPAPPGLAAKPAAPEDKSAEVPLDAAVITVKGVCPAVPKAMAAKTGAAKPASASAKTSSADCKTVITRAEFEKLAKGLAPNVTPQLRRQLSTVLPRLVAMSDAAKKKGLENSPEYEETLKFAKMQILTNELQRSVQEQAAKISDADIEDYYKSHAQNYQQYNLDRLFVPRTKQAEPAKEEDKDEKLTEAQQKEKEEKDKAKEAENEQDMTKLADALRARAASGEDFAKLQKEAYDSAGMKIESPSVNLPNLRRTGLPPAQAAVFDLKPGDVSQVITDSGGHYIYKLVSEQELPLDQVKNEIHTNLQSERVKEAMDKYQNSFTVETNADYFGPAAPAGGMRPMPPRMSGPRMAPGPAQSSGSPANPPQAQPAPPAASKPD